MTATPLPCSIGATLVQVCLRSLTCIMHLLGGAGLDHALLPAASLVLRVCDVSSRCIPDFSPLRIAAGLVMLMVQQQPQQQALVVDGIKDDVVKLVAIKGNGGGGGGGDGGGVGGGGGVADD